MILEGGMERRGEEGEKRVVSETGSGGMKQGQEVKRERGRDGEAKDTLNRRGEEGETAAVKRGKLWP